MIRLDKLLSSRGYCSRKEARAALGRVLVAGAPPRSFDQKVDPGQVTWDGEPLDPEQLLVLLHKPAGYTCSHQDKGPLVFELLPERWRDRNPEVNCVGRLDKDTTGVLLLTDHGQLLHRLTSPRFKLPKLYRVRLSQEVEDSQLELVRQGGLELDGEPLLPAGVTRVGPQEVLLELVEGRYHQIKRTFPLLGAQVERLERVSFAGLELEGLEPGHYRLVEPAVLLSRVGL